MIFFFSTGGWFNIWGWIMTVWKLPPEGTLVENAMRVCYLLSQSEGTAKLLSITVARPHLYPCVNDLKKKKKKKKKARLTYGSVQKQQFHSL